MKKSYELYDVGNKVVLRQLVEPDYEMKTVLVADSLVSVKDANQRDLSSIADLPFFILKKEDFYFIFWERFKCLQCAPECEAFQLIDGNVLLKKEGCWYWWPADAGVSALHPLGKQISALGRLFLFKQNREYLFNYIEGGEVKTRSCYHYDVLNVDFQEHEEKEVELFPDLLRLSNEDGDLFVSVERTTEVIKVRGNKIYLHFYAFQFKNESAEKLIDFASYVRKFCDKMSAEGIEITDSRKICDYAYIRQHIQEHNEFKISLNIDLRGNSFTCVSVVACVSKLYQGADEAYQVYCSELDYYYSADDVWLENSARERALFMTCDGKTDKISCATTDIQEEQYLVLSKNV